MSLGGQRFGNMSIVRAGTHVLNYGSVDNDEEEEGEEEENASRRRDPCFHYTVLDQDWRATNTTTKFKMCDRNVKWKGSSFNLNGCIYLKGYYDIFVVGLCDVLVNSKYIRTGDVHQVWPFEQKKPTVVAQNLQKGMICSIQFSRF